MATPVLPSTLLQAVFDQLILLGSESVTVSLFTNDLDPDKDTTIDDFIEASYPGYAEYTLGVAPAIADGNQFHLTAGHATFSAPTTGDGVDLYGLWVEWTPPSTVEPLLFSMRFDDAPLNIAPGDLPLAVFIDLYDLDTNNP